MVDPTERFGALAGDYARYRPGYPAALGPLVMERAGLRPGARVADVGCGTGLSSELLLEAGCTVIGIEPNLSMRQEASARLGAHPRFVACEGSAEHTGLPAHGADLIFAAQAFHWFDVEATRAEFTRVLGSGGPVALVWNTRRTDTPFGADYEAMLLKHGTDYAEVGHRSVDVARVSELCNDGEVRHDVVPNAQRLDRESLRGRTLSSSYLPGPGDLARGPLLEDLERVFEAHAADGMVCMDYDTELYSGRVTG